MPIRLTALLALALSACGFQSDPVPDAEPTLSAVEQTVGSCSIAKYICDPDSIWSNWECEQVCDNHWGHRLEYTTHELLWCAAHPDHSYNPLKFCGPDG